MCDVPLEVRSGEFVELELRQILLIFGGRLHRADHVVRVTLQQITTKITEETF